LDEAEDKLFHKILTDTNRALLQLLPDQRGELTYSLETTNSAIADKLRDAFRDINLRKIP